MHLQHSMYHIILRTTALTLALVLLFDSGVLAPVTKEISNQTQSYLASAIGMTASVQPTELNQYTAQLAQREKLLTEREAEVAAREIAVNLAESGAQKDYSTYILSVLLFILLVLIVLNYVLDYIRQREGNAHHHEKVA